MGYLLRYQTWPYGGPYGCTCTCALVFSGIHRGLVVTMPYTQRMSSQVRVSAGFSQAGWLGHFINVQCCGGLSGFLSRRDMTQAAEGDVKRIHSLPLVFAMFLHFYFDLSVINVYRDVDNRRFRHSIIYFPALSFSFCCLTSL